MGLSIIIFKKLKVRTQSWSANSIETGKTAWLCRLVWFYTGGKADHFHLDRIRVKLKYFFFMFYPLILQSFLITLLLKKSQELEILSIIIVKFQVPVKKTKQKNKHNVHCTCKY